MKTPDDRIFKGDGTMGMVAAELFAKILYCNDVAQLYLLYKAVAHV